MGTAIRTRLVKIGKSQGIRIPKTLVEQLGLRDDVELEAQDGQLVIRPAQHPRSGWDERFRAMAEHGDDRLLDGDALAQTAWDESEWQW